MTNEALQFVFSLFSLIGVIGIIFYLILHKAKSEKLFYKIEDLEDEIILLKNQLKNSEYQTTKNETTPLNTNLESTNLQSTNPESTKEKIIELYEQGLDTFTIESQLNVPKATIDMVLKFHAMNKADNWRDSVN